MKLTLLIIDELKKSFIMIFFFKQTKDIIYISSIIKEEDRVTIIFEIFVCF